jgi:hypothetical protein
MLNVNRAFKLPVSRVIHTVGPIYDMDKQPEVSLNNAYTLVVLSKLYSITRKFVVACKISEITVPIDVLTAEIA